MILSVKEYLHKNPEATLADYSNYIDEENKRTKDAAELRQKNYNEWIKSKIGSYFLINFNGSSKMVFELAYRENFGRTNKDLVAKISYEFYKDSSNMKFITEKNRTINEQWLPNPYNERIFRECNKGIYELTKEEFDEYVNTFENLKKMYEDCERMYSQIKEKI